MRLEILPKTITSNNSQPDWLRLTFVREGFWLGSWALNTLGCFKQPDDCHIRAGFRSGRVRLYLGPSVNRLLRSSMKGPCRSLQCKQNPYSGRWRPLQWAQNPYKVKSRGESLQALSQDRATAWEKVKMFCIVDVGSGCRKAYQF